jgi:hypothetical protein
MKTVRGARGAVRGLVLATAIGCAPAAVTTPTSTAPTPVTSTTADRAPRTADRPRADYDLVIRNGRVLDGAGNPWILADVAISGGRFVRVGKVEGQGKAEIDARGKYVSPGWIDMMDQSGSVLPRNGLAENKLRMV